MSDKPQAFIANFAVAAGDLFDLDWQDEVLAVLPGKGADKGLYHVTVLRRQQ